MSSYTRVLITTSLLMLVGVFGLPAVYQFVETRMARDGGAPANPVVTEVLNTAMSWLLWIILAVGIIALISALTSLRSGGAHRWAGKAARRLITALTPGPGNGGQPWQSLVVDPFVGGGQTAIAAYESRRRFLGGDTNPRALRLTAARVSVEATPASAAWSSHRC